MPPRRSPALLVTLLVAAWTIISPAHAGKWPGVSPASPVVSSPSLASSSPSTSQSRVDGRALGYFAVEGELGGPADDDAVTCPGACHAGESFSCPTASPVCCGPCTGYFCCPADTICCGSVPGNVTCCPYGTQCNADTSTCESVPVLHGCGPEIYLSRLTELSGAPLPLIVESLNAILVNEPCMYGPFSECNVMDGDCYQQELVLPPYFVDFRVTLCSGTCGANGSCGCVILPTDVPVFA
jgi:hypothetical protein